MNETYLTNNDILIELIPDLVFIKDLSGVIVQANQRYINFIDKSYEEVIGKSDFDFLSQEDAIHLANNDKIVIFTKKAHAFYDKIVKEDNCYYFKTTKSPLYNEQNQVVGIFCVAKDITKEKQLEIIQEDTNTLLEFIATENNLNKTLHKIVELAESKGLNIKCSILILDDTKSKLYCGAAPSLPSFYNEAIDGIEIGDKVGSCGAASYNRKRVIIDNIDTHENWANYLELTNMANLHSCWSEPIFASNNEVLGTFAMYSSEHRKPSKFEFKLIETYAYISSIAIEKNKNIQKLLEQEKVISQQSKLASMGEMIANIAHQWRQPLSIISTSATGMILQKDYEKFSDEELVKTCMLINDNAQYLSKTIDDFRNFITDDRTLSKFNLKETVNDFLNLVHPSIKRHDIKIVLNVDESIIIEGYSNELLQCFMNIFNNAKDALKKLSSSEKYFFIESYIENNFIIMRFKDNAGGIQEDIISRIFEPYFTTKHRNIGTGLGLSMTYNLINEGMKGSIIATNVKFNHSGNFYKGAEFIINLPLSKNSISQTI